MGQDRHASKDERLIREARTLLILALRYTSLPCSPLALLPVLDALRSLDEFVENPVARQSGVPGILDEVRHAMRMTWTSSNLGDIPVFSAWFILVLARVESRVLGYPETVPGQPERASECNRSLRPGPASGPADGLNRFRVIDSGGGDSTAGIEWVTLPPPNEEAGTAVVVKHLGVEALQERYRASGDETLARHYQVIWR